MKLYDSETDQLIGELSEADFQFLHANLVEESVADDDYYINQDTLDMLAVRGASAGLLMLLQNALGNDGEAEIRWSAD
jgi:hypothetical protein